MTPKERAAMQQALEACKRNQSAQAQAILEEALAGDNMTPTEQVELNLNCKSVQKRLATVWGYVKAEQADEEGKITDYMLGFSDGKHYAHKYEQAEQEPVAKFLEDNLVVENERVGKSGHRVLEIREEELLRIMEIYAAPVRTKDLTDAEIAALVQRHTIDGKIMPFALCEAVIAAYKEKNK